MKKIMRERINYYPEWAKIKPNNDNYNHLIRNKEIIWLPDNLPYYDHIEMSGFYTSAIISYGADDNGYLRLFRHVTFPSLRLYPNDTHSSFDYNYKGIEIKVNNQIIKEKVIKIIFNGILIIKTQYENLYITRKITTARNSAGLIELLEFTNKDDNNYIIEIVNNDKIVKTNVNESHYNNSFTLKCIIDNDNINLLSKKSCLVSVIYTAYENYEPVINEKEELLSRKKFIEHLDNTLIIKTPDEIINLMARYAKIRATESIYDTKCGLMHSPGGGGYYAAVWTNDQCEYVNPLFAYLGYDKAIEQAINCYQLYTRYIFEDKALISSIIAEGEGIWHGAKDRGDSAMYAYGAARFVMSLGNKEIALSLLDNIRKCMDFTISQINKRGVVKSDSDELENRFKSGKANLSTSCLAYDALISCSYLENEIGDIDRYKKYKLIAEQLQENIEKYFGCNVEGYNTYRYCKNEKKLRSWICLPLVVGIHNRANETVKALCSNKLRVNEGLLTRSGDITFWDRSTLYALRGLFYANYADEAIELLKTYSKSRLLGNHIPYAIEAYPEGNQAQLSAESGLYLRILTEGILGYRPIGLNKFELKPNLPSKWEYFTINNFYVHGKKLNIDIQVYNNQYSIKLNDKRYTVKFQDTLKIEL